MNRIEELTALLEQITPGKWEIFETGTFPRTNHFYGVGSTNPGNNCYAVAAIEGWTKGKHPNAEFIAAAPEAVRDLLEVVKAAQVMLDAIDKGSVDSAEIVPVPGDGQPYRFHEEWAHRTRKALEAFK